MSLKTFPYFWKFEVEWSFWNIQILTSMIKDIMLGNLGTHFCSLFFRVHRPSLAENIVVCSPNPPPHHFLVSSIHLRVTSTTSATKFVKCYGSANSFVTKHLQ